MSKDIKNILFVISLCTISFASGFAIKQKNKEIKNNISPTIPAPQSQVRIENFEDIERELSEIKYELAKIRAEQRGINQVLGAVNSGSITEFVEYLESLKDNPSVTENLPLGHVKANTEKYQIVEVHESPNFSSRIIDSMDKYKSYPYLEKNNNWYKIEISDAKTGYVNTKFVIEETNKKLQ